MYIKQKILHILTYFYEHKTFLTVRLFVITLRLLSPINNFSERNIDVEDLIVNKNQISVVILFVMYYSRNLAI